MATQKLITFLGCSQPSPELFSLLARTFACNPLKVKLFAGDPKTGSPDMVGPWFLVSDYGLRTCNMGSGHPRVGIWVCLQTRELSNWAVFLLASLKESQKRVPFNMDSRYRSFCSSFGLREPRFSLTLFALRSAQMGATCCVERDRSDDSAPQRRPPAPAAAPAARWSRCAGSPFREAQHTPPIVFYPDPLTNGIGGRG